MSSAPAVAGMDAPVNTAGVAAGAGVAGAGVAATNALAQSAAGNAIPATPLAAAPATTGTDTASLGNTPFGVNAIDAPGVDAPAVVTPATFASDYSTADLSPPNVNAAGLTHAASATNVQSVAAESVASEAAIQAVNPTSTRAMGAEAAGVIATHAETANAGTASVGTASAAPVSLDAVNLGAAAITTAALGATINASAIDKTSVPPDANGLNSDAGNISARDAFLSGSINTASATLPSIPVAADAPPAASIATQLSIGTAIANAAIASTGLLAAVAATVAATTPLRSRSDDDSREGPTTQTPTLATPGAAASQHHNATGLSSDTRHATPAGEKAHGSAQSSALPSAHATQSTRAAASSTDAESQAHAASQADATHKDDAAQRPSAVPNAALLTTLAAGASSLFSASASAASSATSTVSAADSTLSGALNLPNVASPDGTAMPSMNVPDVTTSTLPPVAEPLPQVEAYTQATEASHGASLSTMSNAGITSDSNVLAASTTSVAGSETVLNSAPSIPQAAMQTPGFVPESGTSLPQGAGLPAASGGGLGIPGTDTSATSNAPIGVASAGTSATAAAASTSSSAASASTAATGGDATVAAVSAPGAGAGSVAQTSSAPGGVAGTDAASGAGTSVGADAGGTASTNTGTTAGINAGSHANAGTATPGAAATSSAATGSPAGSAPTASAPNASAPIASTAPASPPDTVLGSTTARAAGMSDSTPATSATDLSAAAGAGAATSAAASSSGAGASGIAAVAAGGGLATFAQQASAASTAISSASTFAAGGVSANVGAAIVPVMTQALNASGDRMAALSSAVDTLFNLPDVNQSNIPSVAGAILSMPGLSSSSVPGVIGAILQSPTLATETLPKVADVLMKIPGVADSPLPQIARDVLDTIGLGPVARTQGTNLPGGTPSPSGSGRVVPGISTYRARQDGARLQYVNLAQVADRWNDGSALTTTERQSNRPRIHVEFNRPGQHRFTITVKADPANIPYSARERGRRASYQEPHSNPRSYVTNADGTRIVDDITLPAAGLNLYLFEVRDERGQLIKTERVETVRRLYIQEVMCMSAHPAGHLADVTPVTAEFALHGIDMIQLPRLQFRGRSAVDAADTPESQQAIMSAVRAVYASSAGKQREPYTLVVCHVDRLAAPGVSGDMRLPVPAGPGGRVMTVPIVNDDRSRSSLWYEFDASDDWLVHARYLYTDASGAERSIPIPRHLITPIRESNGSVWSVSVDLTRVSPTPLTGMLNIQFNTVAASYAGLAITGTNLLFVSTLDPYEPNSQAYLTETLAHEMGHLLGMVPSGPDWPGLRNQDESADDSKLDPPPHFYYNAGGHCYYGLPDQNGEYNEEIGQCVMYGITCANIHFCPSCSKAVRKVDCSEGWTAF